LSTSDAEEVGRTAPIELPPQPTNPPPPAPPPEPVPEPVEDGEVVAPVAPAAPAARPPVAEAVTATKEDVVYVPLAITIGDGFKFGCGFFLAFVLAGLVGFVLIAALFLLTSLFGLNLPITR
jgi:hypothetical protein